MSPRETENRNGDSIAVEPTFPHNEVTNVLDENPHDEDDHLDIDDLILTTFCSP